ncbi:MAG: DNA-directed RNA polymerase subunit beta [Chloroflexi bacterium]|nr:DNA-directed RNA polymerase subunit beta [Chloroflexota bacterium]
MAAETQVMTRPAVDLTRKAYGRLKDILDVPSLIEVQIESFRRFQREGIKELLDSISPIEDFTGNKLALHFKDPDSSSAPWHEFKAPKYSEAECRERDITFAAPMEVKVRLVIKETGEVKEQKLYFGEFPLMTANGTFIINGAERVVVSQLIRSPGVYFTREEDVVSGRGLCFAKLIPDRGAWLEFETSNKDVMSVKFDGKRKVPITTLLRARGLAREDKIRELFADVDNDPAHHYIKATMERETMVEETEGESHRLESEEEALKDIYRRLRPGDPPNTENAKHLIDNLLFNPKRYDLGRVGRYKLNKRLARSFEHLGVSRDENIRVLTDEDLIAIIRHIIMVNNGQDTPDDIDHLGNRRIRTVGELIQNHFRAGLLRLEGVVKERMSIIDPVVATPGSLIIIRPIVAAMREFFGGSQLSQFMDQTNPLAELTHKRRLSALGPGGLSRERAGFEVRDVHHSHYGRICPIETPEGPNIGLIGSLATYSRVNEYGFIETPYRKVLREVENVPEQTTGRRAAEAIHVKKGGEVIIPAGGVITRDKAEDLAKLRVKRVPVAAYVSDGIEYLTADKEEEKDPRTGEMIHVIAQSSALIDAKGQFQEDKVEARQGSRYFREAPDKIDYMDVSPKQIVSITTSMIPFLEHDDANRALMGSNMQRQAVPLVKPEAPLVATGMERVAARDSGQILTADNKGVVISVGPRQEVVKRAEGTEEVRYVSGIVVKYDDGNEIRHDLTKFTRTNQGTCLNQRPVVQPGQRVDKGQVLADGSSTDGGELALGQNILCAFMSWEGYNYEDAIVISEEMVKEDKFTSVHIEKYELEARDTKLGPEEITRDIPNVGEEGLRDLDEQGIIRIGAEVNPGDILVGKITPKGETELTPEAKLLRAIFGEKAREVRDTSLRVPHGEQGTVINVRVFSRKLTGEENRLGKEDLLSIPNGKEFARVKSDDLPAGVNELVKVWVARKRKISVGDKMAGRHGNKGVIARILPVEDMPFLPDGRAVQIILNPIGVPSRMNLGQVFETHLGLGAETIGFRALSPVFDGATDKDLEDVLGRSWLIQKAASLGHYTRNGGGPAPALSEETRNWVKDKGYDPEKVFSEDYPGEARRACLSLWLKLEHGVDPADMDDEQLMETVAKLEEEKGVARPIWGKTTLYDGRTGEPFDKPVTVGNIYIMKLIHLVEDKVHARSTGSYSLITQQPLGGKAQFGGQRFGEMEVWTLEAYGAAHTLQEMLTIKSDDVDGRAKAYQSIVKGEDIAQPGVPESFKVLVKELQSLALAVEVLDEGEERIPIAKEESSEGSE